MQKVERNYWPHAIITGIFLIACACVATVVIALSDPVEMDTFYFESYQKIDRNINTIKESQKNFDEKYSVNIATNSLHVKDENSVTFSINSQDELKDVKIEALLTRPDTNDLNVALDFVKDGDTNSFISKPFTIKNEGRWIIQSKISIGEDTGFFSKEVNTTN
ncbi:MAG: FixH family protein [Campylobacteraceae bacterium]